MGLLPGLALAAEVQIWIVEPSSPGNLADCPRQAAHEVSPPSSAAHRLGADATLRWAGGQIPIVGVGSDEHPTDHCFALIVDGRVVASGATLAPYSARLLHFPVIQVGAGRAGQPLDLLLAPHFPATLSDPVPTAWREALSPLR